MDPDGSAGEMPLTGDMIRVGYHWTAGLVVLGADGTESGFQVGPHRSDFEAMAGRWFSNTALDGRIGGDPGTHRHPPKALSRPVPMS